MNICRCTWCAGDELLIRYHDEEWGVRRLHDERTLFEFLVLETMQCGLSWLTVLRKRESMRMAFDNFEPAAIAGYGAEKLAELMDNASIIRSRPKLDAMVNNARCFLDIASEFGSFDSWLWGFTHGSTICLQEDVPPAQTPLSAKISRALKHRGFRYTGPVVVYSYMQAVGMVNDHEANCSFSNILK